MSVLNQYKKNAGAATAVGQSQKTKEKFSDTATMQGSPLLKQVESTTKPSALAPNKGVTSYTEQVFNAQTKGQTVVGMSIAI